MEGRAKTWTAVAVASVFAAGPVVVGAALLSSSPGSALVGGPSLPPAPSSTSAPAVCVVGKSTVTGKVLPDRHCTPGKADPSISVRDLCPGVGPKVVRSVSQSTKDRVRRDYADRKPGEIDHLISLQLGGSNDRANLWPEDGPVPNPKDAVENALHRWVCAKPSATRLKKAQQAIRTDWSTAERITTS